MNRRPAVELAVELPGFWSPIRAWRPALLAGLLAFANYAGGASPRVHTFDPAEFQTLAACGGIAHAGYPTVVMLLLAFGRLPFGTLPWRANLLSACSGAIAVALLAWTATRLTRRPAAGVVAALAFSLSFSMWKESSLAGVHAPTLALDAVLFLVALRYAWRPSLAGAALGGLACGLGLTCHLTVLALAPPALVAFATGLRRTARRARHVLVAAFALALGLLPFAYTLANDRPERPMNYLQDVLEPGDPLGRPGPPDLARRLARLEWLVSGREYLRGAHRSGRALALQGAYLLAEEGVNEYPLATLPLAVAGLALLLLRRGTVATLVALWFAGALALVGLGSSSHTSRFFFLPGAWVLGLGLATLLARLGARRPGVGAAVAALVLALPFARLAVAEPPPPLTRLPMVPGIWRLWPGEWRPWHADARYEQYGRGVMSRLSPRAVVLGMGWDECTTLRFFVHGERLRPDVDVMYAGPHAPRVTRMWRAAVAAGRPAYATGEPDPGALPGAVATKVWDSGWRGLWRIVPAPDGGVPPRRP